MAQQADPWAKYTRNPDEKPPPKDWSKAPWSEVAWEGVKNLIPSYTQNAWQTIKGLPGQVQDVAQALVEPQKAKSPSSRLMATTAVPPFMVGRYDPVSMALDAVQMARGLKQHVTSNYTDPGALKRTLATNPGGALMDLQALASLPEGGEGVAARLPGVTGKVARGAVTGAKTFNRATNPVRLAAERTAAGAQALQKAVRGGAPLTKAGEFTPQALQAVAEAFPNGEVGNAELANPRFKQVLTDTFRNKGVSAASAREAVLRYNGAPAPASVVTRSKPPRAAAVAVQDAAADARRAIAARAQAISGAAEPDQAALGSALMRAHSASDANVSILYRDMSQVPGVLHPVFKDILSENLENGLRAENLPATRDELGAFPSHTHSREAFDFLQDQIGRLADQNQLTFPAVERARQELNALWKGAKGNDRMAISTMRDALDQSVSDVLSHSVPEGAPVDFTAEDFGRARQARAAHASLYENPKTANPSVINAIRRAGAATPDIEGNIDPDLATGSAAQGVLSRALINPRSLALSPGGPKLYQDLSKILDDPGREALASHLRQSALRVGDDGALVAKPGQIRDFLDSPLGRVFSPQEQSDVRLLAAGQDVLNAKVPYEAGERSRADILGRMVRTGIGATAGYAGAHLLPLPGVPEAVGAGAGAIIEQGIEPWVQRRQIRRELAGAPAVGASLDVPIGMGRSAATVSRALPALRALQETQEPEPEALKPHPVTVPEDLSTLPGPFDEPRTEPPQVLRSGADPWARYLAAPSGQTPEPKPQDDLSQAPGPFDDDRIGRAAGGKVQDEIEPLVQRLIKLAKEAKKTSNRVTEPLLTVPDSTVAKALAIAQRSI